MTAPDLPEEVALCGETYDHDLEETWDDDEMTQWLCRNCGAESTLPWHPRTKEPQPTLGRRPRLHLAGSHRGISLCGVTINLAVCEHNDALADHLKCQRCARALAKRTA